MTIYCATSDFYAVQCLKWDGVGWCGIPALPWSLESIPPLLSWDSYRGKYL